MVGRIVAVLARPSVFRQRSMEMGAAASNYANGTYALGALLRHSVATSDAEPDCGSPGVVSWVQGSSVVQWIGVLAG